VRVRLVPSLLVESVDKCTSKGRSYENLQNDVIAAGRGNLIFNFRGPGGTIFPTALAANLTAEATDVATPVTPTEVPEAASLIPGGRSGLLRWILDAASKILIGGLGLTRRVRNPFHVRSIRTRHQEMERKYRPSTSADSLLRMRRAEQGLEPFVHTDDLRSDV